MKKTRLFIPLAALLAVMVLFSSCSQNSANHIPKEAFAVLVIDGGELLKFNDPEFIQGNAEFKEAIKEVEKESKKAAELIEKIIKDPNASGILLKEKSYAFAATEGKEMVFGLIIPIKQKTLEENLDVIAKEFNVPVSMFMKESDGIQYMEPEPGMIFGWNEDVFMFLFQENSEKMLSLLEKYMNLKSSESIMSDKDFKKFHKNCKAFNVWVSSNVIDNIDIDKEMFKEFEKLTGIEIAGNYGHMHLDLQKDYITQTSTLRFNESIQNMDKKKLVDNIEKLIELFEDPINSGMDLFGGGDSYFGDDDWEDYDGGEWEYNDEDWEGFTEEEWEELLKSLETETVE